MKLRCVWTGFARLLSRSDAVFHAQVEDEEDDSEWIDSKKPVWLRHLIRTFFEHRGHDVIQKRLAAKPTAAGPPLSLHLLRNYIFVIRRLFTHLNRDWGQLPKIAAALYPAVVARVRDITEEEIKTLWDDRIFNFHESFTTAWTVIARCADPAHSASMSDTVRLEIAYRLLRCKYLEKRLAGLNEIRGACKRGAELLAHRDEESNWETVDATSIADWLKSADIIEYLFGSTFHQELAKRSGDVVSFLASFHDGGLPAPIIDKIWDAQVNKHESITHLIYGLFAEISPGLGVKGLPYLLDKVRKLPLSDYNPPLINLIASVGQMMTWYYDAGWFPEGKRWQSSLPILWSAISSGQLSAELLHHCVEGFCKILEMKDSAYFERFEAAELCFQAFRSRSEHAQSAYRIMFKIIESNWKDELSTSNMEQENEQKLPQVRQDLTTLIFKTNNLPTVALEESGAFIVANLAATPTHIDRATLLSSARQRLDYFGAFLRYGRVLMSREHINFIWEHIVSRVGPDVRDMILKWLVDNAVQSTQMEPVVNSADAAWLFETYMKDMSFVGLGENGFKSFEHFLRVAASAAEKTAIIDAAEKKPEYGGHDSLWRLCLDCDSTAVSQLGIFTLVRFHAVPPAQGGDATSPPELLLRNTAARLKSFAQLVATNESPDASRRVSRCLMILQKLLADLNTFSSASQTSAGHGQGQGRLVKISVQIVTRGKFDVNVFSGDTIWVVKQKIAAASQDVPSMLRLINAGKELKNDEQTLDSYIPDVKDGTVIHGTKRTAIAGSPSEQAPGEAKRLSLTETTNTLASILAESYFSDLFGMLSLPGALGQQVWDLLMKLPTNRNQLTQLRGLDLADSSLVSWQSLFDLGSTFKLFYSLQIVDSLLHSPVAPNADAPEWSREVWSAKFVSLGGVRFLFHALLNVDFLDESKGSKRLACLAIMIRIISDFCLEKHTPNPEEKTPSPSLVKRGALESAAVDAQSVISRLLDIVNACAAGGSRFGAEESAPAAPATPAADAAAPRPDTPGEQLAIATLSLLSAICIYSNHGVVLGKLPTMPKWLETTLLLGYSDRIREMSRLAISQVLDRLDVASASSVVSAVLPVFLKLAGDIPTVPISSPLAFFNLAAQFVRKGPVSAPLLDSLASFVAGRITGHSVVELRGVPFQDFYFQGILDLLVALIEISPHHKQRLGGNPGGLVQWLFQHGLFEIATPENNGPNCPPICKAPQTRVSAFRALYEFSRDCDEAFEILTRCLKNLLRTRDRPLKLWQYAPAGIEKASSGLVGLKNLGATCYMNSLTQQFYMIPQFRAELLRAKEASAEDPNESLLVQMQAIMANLQESERRFYDTTPFCKVYKPSGNQPMNPGVQMDVDEFCLSLFDRLEKSTKGTQQEKILKDFFGGQFAQQIVSRECEHVSEREEDFFNLSVEVKGKRKLEESLDLFVKGDLLDGDNKYFCDKCNKRVDALKRCCLATLPNNLFIHLKRFDFDFELLRRSKVNDYCEFPLQLNLEPFTREGLARREKNEEPATPEELRNYDYELTGVIVHSGTVDSGHYYSFIKDRLSTDNKWYLFNDTQVEPFDPAELAGNCFGGYDASYRGGRALPKHYNAYMLVYSKAAPTSAAVATALSRADLARSVPRSLYDETWRDNIDFLTDKWLFDAEFFHFASSVVQAQLPVLPQAAALPYSPELRMGNPAPFDRIESAVEVGLRLFVEVLVHAKDREPKLSELHTTLQAMLSRSVRAAQWFLRHMCRTEMAWVHKLLQECPVQSIREKFAALVASAVTLLSAEERPFYGQSVDPAKFVDSEEDIRDRTLEQERHEDRKRRLQDARAKLNQQAKKLWEEREKQPYEEDELRALPAHVRVNVNSDIIPRALTIEFLDRLLLLLPEMHLFSRQFGEYFSLFEHVSRLSAAERMYLVDRNAINAFLELYLGPESPNWVGPKRPSGIPAANEASMLANMKPALAAVIGVLLRSKAPLHISNPAAPSSSDVELDLPQSTASLLLSPTVLCRLVDDDVHPEAVYALLRYWSTDCESVSNSILTQLFDQVALLQASGMQTIFNCIAHLVATTDSLSVARITRIVNASVKLTLEQTQHKQCMFVCVKFLVDLAEDIELARNLLFESRQAWLLTLLFHSFEPVRTATEQLILTILLPTDSYDNGYDRSVIAEKFFSGEIEQARSQRRKLLFSHPPPQSVASLPARMSQLLEDLISFLKGARQFAFFKSKQPEAVPDPSCFGLRQYGRLLNFFLRTTEEKVHFVSYWPILLDLLAHFEISANQKQNDWSKAELFLFLDKLTDGCSEMCTAVIASLSHLDEKELLMSLISYAFYADTSSATLAAFNEVNMTCYWRIMERLSRLSKDFMVAVATSRVYAWLLKWTLLAETDYPRSAAGLLSFTAYVASTDVNWRRGQIISAVPQIAARASSSAIGRQFQLLHVLLLDSEDYLQFCEHKGLTWIVTLIVSYAALSAARTAPDTAFVAAVSLMQRSLEAWRPAFVSPSSEAVRDRAGSFKAQIMLPAFTSGLLCSSLSYSLCYAEEHILVDLEANVPFAKSLGDLLDLLTLIEPNKFSDDAITGLRKYFQEGKAQTPSTDMMEVDATAAHAELGKIRERSARLFCKAFPIAIRRRVATISERAEAAEALVAGGIHFDTAAQFFSTWGVQYCPAELLGPVAEELIKFFPAGSSKPLGHSDVSVKLCCSLLFDHSSLLAHPAIRALVLRVAKELAESELAGEVSSRLEMELSSWTAESAIIAALGLVLEAAPSLVSERAASTLRAKASGGSNLGPRVATFLAAPQSQ